jgi:hypothetical protein
MSDTPVVHIGENSPEEVAFKLMEKVARLEKKIFYHSSERTQDSTADRQWLLDTYAECLHAVRGYREFRDAREFRNTRDFRD